MTFDVLNTWCVSTQFHPVLVISVPCWRALALKTTTRKKHPPHFLYNLFACRIGYWTCCFYCNLSQKKISVFSHSFVKFRPYFFIFFPAKSTPPPKKKHKEKHGVLCWHVDMTYLTPPQQHEKTHRWGADFAPCRVGRFGGVGTWWLELVNASNVWGSSLGTFWNHLGIDYFRY